MSVYGALKKGSGAGRLANVARLERYRDLIRVSLMVGAALIDLTAIGGAGVLSALWRYGNVAVVGWLQSLQLLAPSYLVVALALRAYSIGTLRSITRSVLTSAMALLGSSTIALSVVFALKVGEQLSRFQTGLTIVLALFLMTGFRLIGVRLIRRTLHAIVEQRIVVLTDGVGVERRAGNKMTFLVDVRTAGIVPDLRDPAFFDNLGHIVRDADRVVLAFSDPSERQSWAEAMRQTGMDAEVVADLGYVRPVALSYWQDHTTLVISRGPLNLGERLLKRAFDLTVTCGILLFAGPVIAICAVLVRLDSPGPAFFIQERTGRNNRIYRCFKLRTMRTDLTDAHGGVSASRGDERITRIGGILRRTSLDELPQLFNVLKGDMSLVGPRPHALASRAEGALFWDLVPDYWSRHAMRPGVTGLAQVRGFRGATHSRSDIERRVAADLEYINGWSLWLDIKILIMTVRVAVHHNAY
ncbi:exopolysaccharide biosynthesis polyprenyl glycosylphosphotransferase [Ancylobacter pratisalsi]|uniref:Exopolysaccharide biosynthesis polyprenyl glycosylphosphotransferase n=1 Tax=Ancylobacter pratisalsi TaxID=1745854 RepID=A0A6P1YI15_9HYPH|nr:exopolysaccharide biosynthesis polyprenyl glycosylphosphotransferase [Ancylobacter pratisalsi]QIB32346.1 exopolysaccharide biosynthesis polyprenyl glycosylphosphotransferase [Ancylobacter pratisalsi]